MMNYAQVLEQIEQLKIGKKVSLKENPFSKVLYIPESYTYDCVGEYAEAILKEHKFAVARLTKFAIKRPLGHILYNGKTISQKDFAKYGEMVIERAVDSRDLTKTEAFLGIAFQMFSEKKADYIILPSDEMADFEAYKERYVNSPLTSQKEVMKEIVCSFLEREGVIINEKLVEKAITKSKCEGHFELLKKKPYFLADGADDGESVKRLMANLQYHYPNNPYIFIVGTMKEGYEDVVKESARMARQIITVTPFECQKALNSLDLAEEFGKLNPNITNVSSIEEAIEIATILADKDTVVVAFGTTAILAGYRDTVLKGV